ncbi:MAG: zinc-dependent alcohol dehydrogenase [Christensenellales bacterium]|jgi:L-iditol 2-dehydrogenase
MKALVMREYNKFTVEDVEKPSFGEEDVLIKVKACSICGSDVHGMDGSSGRRIPPIIMGHEAAGVIEEVGSAVKGWSKGDRVTFDSTIYCGKCHYCESGYVNLCGDRKVLGVSCDEYRQHGALAEYVAVPARILYHLPDNVSFEHAAMVEPVAVAYHAVMRAGMKAGQNALVIGAGTIGVLIMQVLKAFGCSKIIAVDTLDEKLDLAKEMGADITFNSTKTDVLKEISDMTNGEGLDLAFDAVGISPTVPQAIKAVRKGGTVVLVGNLAPEVTFPLQPAVIRQLNIFGTCNSQGEYPECMELISKGKIKLDLLLSARITLEQAHEYFHRLYNKEKGLIKVVVVMEDDE